MIRVTCGSCGKTYQVADEFAGRATRCPGCGANLSIPGTPPVSAAPPAAGAAPLAAPPPIPTPTYGAPPPPPVASGAGMTQQTSGLAIAALILGLIPGCITSILGIVLGLTALRQIDREPHRYTGRGLATGGIILGVCTLVLSMGLLMMGMMLPALGAARRTARRLENDSRVAGMCKGLVVYGSTNRDWYPGFDRDGVPEKRVNCTLLISDRYKILLAGSYFTNAFVISPLENDSSHQVYTGQATGDPLTGVNAPGFGQNHYSYAMLSVGQDGGAGRKTEWAATSNSQAPVVCDRDLTDDGRANGGMGSSIHDARQWRGSVGWNDGHAGFENQLGGYTTKYGASYNMGHPGGGWPDNLFVSETPTGSDAYLLARGDTAY